MATEPPNCHSNFSMQFMDAQQPNTFVHAIDAGVDCAKVTKNAKAKYNALPGPHASAASFRVNRITFDYVFANAIMRPGGEESQQVKTSIPGVLAQ